METNTSRVEIMKSKKEEVFWAVVAKAAFLVGLGYEPFSLLPVPTQRWLVIKKSLLLKSTS